MDEQKAYLIRKAKRRAKELGLKPIDTQRLIAMWLRRGGR